MRGTETAEVHHSSNDVIIHRRDSPHAPATQPDDNRGCVQGGNAMVPYVRHTPHGTHNEPNVLDNSQLVGPPPASTCNVTDNHGSAVGYPTQVQDYLESEIKIGALSGPYEAPPFTPWCVVSPLMTRKKSEVGKRRIIVDLSFPDGGINKQITKNTFDGKGVGHSLPTIMSAVNTINEMGHTDIWLSVIDLSRAYRHFAVCPLDWPLLGIKKEDKYYFDKSLPFGARMSSYVMQTIAAFTVRALKRRNIDTHNNSLSIPEPKLKHIKLCLAQASTLKTLTLKQLQRVIGVVNHLSKVVHPARLFIGGLLAAMRNTGAGHSPVSSGMRAHLAHRLTGQVPFACLWCSVTA